MTAADPTDIWPVSIRVEDEALLTGAAQFVADLVDDATLNCVFVRSPVAHGLLGSVELSSAMASPGVVAAWDAGALGLRPLAAAADIAVPDSALMDRPPLAVHRVRHVGEPVAVVVAESHPTAVDAAELVDVEIDALPVVPDVTAALTGDTLLFPEAGTNVVGRSTLRSPVAPRDGYEVNVSVEVDSHRLSHVTIEPAAILVRPTADGLDVWCGHQAPDRLAHQLAASLGLAPASVRVRVPHVGGAFGLKGQLLPEYIVVAVAARRLRRPIVWVQNRQEQLVCGPHGRAQRHRVELSGDRNGRIRLARIHITADLGAYAASGHVVASSTHLLSTGIYDIDHVEVETTMVVTNRAPICPYRGAGRPEAALAIERGVDAFAAAASLDPIDVRRRNAFSTAQLPVRTATGALYDSGDYHAALDLALAAVDADAVRAEQRARLRDGRDPIGLGVGAFVERAGGPLGLGEYGRVEIAAGGDIVVRTGSVAAGQGHETVWRQLVSTALTVPSERVHVIAGDTGTVTTSVGTFGSRSAQLGGSAIWRSAVAVRERAGHLAAELLECAPDDVELASGTFFVAGAPSAPTVTLAEVSASATAAGDPLMAEEIFDPAAQTFPYGVYMAVVEVDLETGRVRLRQLVTVDDCGNVLNPTIVEGQLHGSVLQGIGQALFEEISYDSDAVPLTSTLVDYLVPTAAEVVPIDAHRLVHPAPSNPLGVKGCGEAGCIGIPPAVRNATIDALRPYGVDDLSLPLTPCKVWQALGRARDRGAER